MGRERAQVSGKGSVVWRGQRMAGNDKMRRRWLNNPCNPPLARAGEVMFVEFVDDVAGALRKASLAICRAGAVACAELACAGERVVGGGSGWGEWVGVPKCNKKVGMFSSLHCNTFAGCPSILVPSPHVTDNHQDANATAMASAGAAVVVNEGPGMEDALVEVCGELLSDPGEESIDEMTCAWLGADAGAVLCVRRSMTHAQ